MIVRDQLNREVVLNKRPLRIISLVPSQTEYLYDLGLVTELVGITKFCIHPDVLFRSCERVGGTKQLDLEKIRSLKPDLIIGNKEENTKEQIEALALDFPVWMSDVNTLEDAFEMMNALAELCGKEEEGRTLVRKAESAMAGCKNIFTGHRIVYLMWYAPWMGVASETFIDSVLKHLGFENAIEHQNRYPALSEADLFASGADYCFLSSEPANLFLSRQDIRRNCRTLCLAVKPFWSMVKCLAGMVRG
jgi:iron complex transport system substrate-binding protein